MIQSSLIIAERLDHGRSRPLTPAELEQPAWFGAAVYLRGRLIGYAPVRWLTWAEYRATVADLDDVCSCRFFRFSGNAWEVVTQQKGTE